MELNDYRTLKVLEAVDQNSPPTQRDLAHRLNISLGNINAFIRKLAHNGYFEVKTTANQRARYLLTPKGMSEKSRLTYVYIRHACHVYGEARHRLRERLNRLTAQGVGRLVLFGATELAEIAYIAIAETPIQLVAVVDQEHRGKTFLGSAVRSPDSLRFLNFDCILVTTDVAEFKPEMIPEELCEPQKVIMPL